MSGISRLPGAEKNSISDARYPRLLTAATNACLHGSVMSVCHEACT